MGGNYCGGGGGDISLPAVAFSLYPPLRIEALLHLSTASITLNAHTLDYVLAIGFFLDAYLALTAFTAFILRCPFFRSCLSRHATSFRELGSMWL